MKKLLILTDYYPPAYKAGGPVRSVSNLVDQLKDHYEIMVVTGDRDLGDSVSFSDEKINEVIAKDNFKVIYLTKERRSSTDISELILQFEPNIIYLNSLFSGAFTVLPLFRSKKIFGNSKIVLAPRGMLHRSALSKKKFKKRIFLRLAKMINLYDNVIWHATSEKEKERIVEEFGQKSDVSVIPNLAAMLQPRNNFSKKSGTLQMMFYGRISVEKNLLGGLKILGNLNLNNVSLHIYGPLEDGKYWSDCKNEIERIEKNSPGMNIEYHGAINPQDLQSVMDKYHLLFSPSGSENFGHAIVEAMSSGMPALISDKTPWQKLESFYAGMDIPLDMKDKWLESIKFFKSMDEEHFKIWSHGAVKYSREIMTDRNALKAYSELFG